MPKRSLTGKVSLVTGSTSGIGLGIARSLAGQGSSLVLNGLVASPQEGEKFKNEFQREFDVRVLFSSADMAKPSEITQMISETLKHFDHLDILVNNAGIQHVSPIEDFPEDKWNAILSVNLSSAFHTIHAALPAMRKQNWGRIVNVASVHGQVASVGKSAYVAAKHGLIGLTKVVALETAETGITCNAICPGWVLTPLVERQINDLAQAENISLDEAKVRLLSLKQPSKEFATTEQIGGTVLFLCSEVASQMRGASLDIDGGWLAQ